MAKQSKLLRVETPTVCCGAIVYYDGAKSWWGDCAPYLKRVIGNMSPSAFKQFLDGTGYRLGWSYEWL